MKVVKRYKLLVIKQMHHIWDVIYSMMTMVNING